jgi:hypothetical protein
MLGAVTVEAPRRAATGTMAFVLSCVLTGTVAACSPPTGDRSSETTTTIASASCVDVVFIEGGQWTSWNLQQPLTRATSGPAVRAEGITCDDVLEPGEAASVAPDPNRPVRLLQIDGIPADQALVNPATPDYVYVHAGPEVNDLDSLPRLVADLLVNG